MCTGGRIRHHLKHNRWRRDAHVVIAGFQARGTPGRALIDGAKKRKLLGVQIAVRGGHEKMLVLPHAFLDRHAWNAAIPTLGESITLRGGGGRGAPTTAHFSFRSASLP